MLITGCKVKDFFVFDKMENRLKNILILQVGNSFCTMILRYIEADLDFGIYALGRWRKSPVMNWWISVYLLWNKGKLQDDIPLLPGYKMVISLSLLIGCFVYLCNKHFEKYFQMFNC